LILRYSLKNLRTIKRYRRAKNLPGGDLSMLVATATVIHHVFRFDKSLSITVIAGAAITAVMSIFSTWHCITDEIGMHSVLFGTSSLPPSFPSRY
jgi:hypothetical protein